MYEIETKNSLLPGIIIQKGILNMMHIVVIAQPGHDPNTQHCLCGADGEFLYH